MDLGKSKSVTPLGSSMESHGPRINKSAFRRFQKFLAMKRFEMPVRSRRLHRAGGIVVGKFGTASVTYQELFG